MTTTAMAGTRDQAERHLRALVGREDVRLHDDQWAAIEALVVEQRLGSAFSGRTPRCTRTMATTLEVVLLYLVAAVGGVVAFRMLHLPPMLGYLAVGVLIGPHALGLAEDSAATHALAEFGVVFLMFSIGLEFSLPSSSDARASCSGSGWRRWC